MMLAAIKAVECGTRDDVVKMSGRPDLVEKDSDNNTLLHYACLAGNLAAVAALVDLGFYIDSANVEGHTPICDAATNGSAEVIRFLIKRGANVNPPAYWGSPLNYAVRNGHYDALVALVDGGANVNACDRTGICAIHVAIQDRFRDAVAYLLISGADPNKRVRLSTPLHMAAQLGETNLVRLLLQNGANPTPVDAEGRKPVDFVQMNSKIYKMLAAYTGWIPSLKFLCRLAIRHQTPSFLTKSLEFVNIPCHLKDYLKFKF